jgi:NAD(P)-dependent dehydrogenase (short-subunit alcohol dehydrogenase family)
VRIGHLMSGGIPAQAGLVADTAVWSKELAKYGIRVGAVAPGVVATAILDSVPPELKERLVQQVWAVWWARAPVLCPRPGRAWALPSALRPCSKGCAGRTQVPLKRLADPLEVGSSWHGHLRANSYP